MCETLRFYKECRAGFNEVRRKLGLPPVLFDKKLRTCLCCDKYFRSFSKNNRICKNCCSKHREGGL